MNVKDIYGKEDVDFSLMAIGLIHAYKCIWYILNCLPDPPNRKI